VGRLRGVIFDLDGTLGDTLPVCFAAFRATFAHYLGRRFEDHEIRAMFGPSEEGVLRRAVPARWEEALETYLREYERAHRSCTAPFPGLIAVLETLRARGLRLAVVTAKGQRSAEISARVLGLEGYFEVMETGSHDGSVKGDRIRAVLARWQIPPGEVAYVGDAASDVVVARQEGLVPLAAAWAGSTDLALLVQREPAALFPTVASFAAWIEATGEEPRGAGGR
jgi:phosphoglycolate phosphatase-like HAD superfamily hydrolase